MIKLIIPNYKRKVSHDSYAPSSSANFCPVVTQTIFVYITLLNV